MKILFENNIQESSGDSLKIKAVMLVEVFVLDRDGGLINVIGQVLKLDWSSVLVGVDFVEKFTVSV